MRWKKMNLLEERNWDFKEDKIMQEEFFTKEVNTVLEEINDCSQTIYRNLVYLHNMTDWTYEEIADKVSRNCDYFSLSDTIRFFADGAEGVEWEMSLWNEVGRGVDISF